MQRGKTTRKERVQAILEQIVETFKGGEVGEALEGHREVEVLNVPLIEAMLGGKNEGGEGMLSLPHN